MTTNTLEFHIKTGPSAGEIWDAGKYAHTKEFTVEFTGSVLDNMCIVPLGETVIAEMQVLGVRQAYETGSGTSLVINGYFVFCENAHFFKARVEFSYDASRREGVISYTRSMPPFLP